MANVTQRVSKRLRTDLSQKINRLPMLKISEKDGIITLKFRIYAQCAEVRYGNYEGYSIRGRE